MWNEWTNEQMKWKSLNSSEPPFFFTDLNVTIALALRGLAEIRDTNLLRAVLCVQRT